MYYHYRLALCDFDMRRLRRTLTYLLTVAHYVFFCIFFLLVVVSSVVSTTTTDRLEILVSKVL